MAMWFLYGPINIKKPERAFLLERFFLIAYCNIKTSNALRITRRKSPKLTFTHYQKR